jgi:DNA-binding GntR family transcriptional regulator
VAVYLASHGIGRDHVIELRRTVETAQVELAVDGLDDEGAERLAATLEAEQRATVDDAHEVHDLHAVVASLTGNRVLELVTLVLIRLSRLHRYERPGVRLGKRLIEQGEKAHAGIVDALVARDVALATHRMRRHLEACARSSAAARRAGGRSSGEAFRWRTAG